MSERQIVIAIGESGAEDYASDTRSQYLRFRQLVEGDMRSDIDESESITALEDDVERRFEVDITAGTQEMFECIMSDINMITGPNTETTRPEIEPVGVLPDDASTSAASMDMTSRFNALMSLISHTNDISNVYSIPDDSYSEASSASFRLPSTDSDDDSVIVDLVAPDQTSNVFNNAIQDLDQVGAALEDGEVPCYDTDEFLEDRRTGGGRFDDRGFRVRGEDVNSARHDPNGDDTTSSGFSWSDYNSEVFPVHLDADGNMSQPPESSNRVLYHDYGYYDLFFLEGFMNFRSSPEAERALGEIWRDLIRDLPPTYVKFDYNTVICASAILTWCERRPYLSVYTQDNPDKSTWSKSAHLARFIWQVIPYFRRQGMYPSGPLADVPRTRLTMICCAFIDLERARSKNQADFNWYGAAQGDTTDITLESSTNNTS